jgi:hypothetical protein
MGSQVVAFMHAGSFQPLVMNFSDRAITNFGLNFSPGPG